MQKKKRAIRIFVFMMLCISFSFPNQLWAEATQDDEAVENKGEAQEQVQEEEQEIEETVTSVKEDVTQVVQETAKNMSGQPISPFADEDTYTLNELFGAGDFTYLQVEINGVLGLDAATSEWTMAQLESVSSLYLNVDEYVDFPSDLSVFTGLESLTINGASALSNLSFKYKNAASQLQSVTISNSESITSIDGVDLDFGLDNGSFYIQRTPSLTNLSNIKTSDVYDFQLMAENVPEEVLLLIEANMENQITVSEADNMTLINNLKNNTTYADAVSMMDYDPITMSNIALGTKASISVLNSYIDTFEVETEEVFMGLNIYNSVLHEIADMNLQWGDNENRDMSIVFSNLLVNRIGKFEISADENQGVNYSLSNITTTTIDSQKIDLSRYSYMMSSVVTNTIGDFELSDGVQAGDQDYSHLNMSFYNVATDKIGKITTSTAALSAYSNIYCYLLIAQELGDISLQGNSVEQDGEMVSYSNQNLHLNFMNVDKLGAISLMDAGDEFDTRFTNAAISLSFGMFGEMQPITMASDYNYLDLLNLQVDEVKDIMVEAVHSNIMMENYETHKINSIGNITVATRNLSSDIPPEDCFAGLSINSVQPIQSIGNISLNTQDAGEMFLWIGDAINDTFKVEKIGSISGNLITELNLHNLGIKFLGELDLPQLQTIDLSGNRLARLLVKDKMFPTTLTSYNFNDNQIAGAVPVESTLVSPALQQFNFFDPTQENVLDQSRLYLLDDGVRYESGSTYTIELGADEELSLDQLLAMVRMYDDDYDDNKERFFDYHVWKYALVSNPLARSLAVYSDEITFGDGTIVQGLVEGENYLELSLYDALTTSGNNENAKLHFKIVKQASSSEGDGDDGSDDTINAGSTMPDTGDTTSGIWGWLFAGSFLLLAAGVAKKAKSKQKSAS